MSPPDMLTDLDRMADLVGHIPESVLDYLEWVCLLPADNPARVELAAVIRQATRRPQTPKAQ